MQRSRAPVPICSTAIASIISSGSIAPLPSDRRLAAAVHPPIRGPARARRASPACSAGGRRLSSPKIRRDLTSCGVADGAAWPATRCSAGSAVHLEGQPFRDRPYRRSPGDVRHARHRADGGLVGGSAARRTRGGAGHPVSHTGSRTRPRAARRWGRRTRFASAARGAMRRARPAPAVQDVFGWRDRINQPATVSDANWTWRLPWPSDRLSTEPEAMEIATQLQEWCRRYRR